MDELDQADLGEAGAAHGAERLKFWRFWASLLFIGLGVLSGLPGVSGDAFSGTSESPIMAMGAFAIAYFILGRLALYITEYAFYVSCHHRKGDRAEVYGPLTAFLALVFVLFLPVSAIISSGNLTGILIISSLLAAFVLFFVFVFFDLRRHTQTR